MARRTTTSDLNGVVEVSPEPIPAPRRRRRRITDPAAQSAALLSALLQTRNERGATQEEIERVVLWGRTVHAEASELASLAGRPRLRKAGVSSERQAAADINSALLDGVLGGQFGLDVDEEGSLVFLQRHSTSISSP
jgi:hypothetical protein